MRDDLFSVRLRVECSISSYWRVFETVNPSAHLDQDSRHNVIIGIHKGEFTAKSPVSCSKLVELHMSPSHTHDTLSLFTRSRASVTAIGNNIRPSAFLDSRPGVDTQDTSQSWLQFATPPTRVASTKGQRQLTKKHYAVVADVGKQNPLYTSGPAAGPPVSHGARCRCERRNRTGERRRIRLAGDPRPVPRVARGLRWLRDPKRERTRFGNLELRIV